MIREAWNRLSPRARRHVIVAGIGFVVAATFGHFYFVVVELALGNPWDELVFGIGGAAIASLGYEIATQGRSA